MNELWKTKTLQPSMQVRCLIFHERIDDMYRVERQTLPVEFFLNFYRMLQDMNLKIGTDLGTGLIL